VATVCDMFNLNVGRVHCSCIASMAVDFCMDFIFAVWTVCV